MEDNAKPQVSASISVDPAVHTFPDSSAPTLKLSIISHYSRPITIYADDLSPALMLKCGAFKLSSLTTGADVKQSVSTHCRIPPPKHVEVRLDESFFYTLYPEVPVTFSTPFTRKRDNNGGNPLPKTHPDYEDHRNAKFGAYGVDGLEPGHDYILTLADTPRIPWTVIRWWDFGTKEEILGASGSNPSLDAFKVKYKPGPHEAIMVGTDSAEPVHFSCRQ